MVDVEKHPAAIPGVYTINNLGALHVAWRLPYPGEGDVYFCMYAALRRLVIW